jgi:uncharacterized protein (DUF58 family)
LAGTEKYLRPDVIRTISRLDLRARFIVEGFLSGLHGSPFQGFSVEFSEHRKYVPGDDIKDIDWGVYAKTEKYYVKKFKAETTMQGWLVVDRSASMGWTHRQELTKFEYGVSLAAALAHLMSQRIEAVLRPKATRTQLSSILSFLSGLAPAGEVALGDCLMQLATVARGKGLVVIFSDLLADPQPVIDGMMRLRHAGHDIILFHILDEAERRFPFEGYCEFQDVESDQRLILDADSIRADYLRALEGFEERYRDACHKAQIDYVAMDTSRNFGDALLEYLQQRSRRG